MSRCKWPDTRQRRHANRLLMWIQRAIKGAYKLAVEYAAAGAIIDTLFSMGILPIILHHLIRQALQWTIWRSRGRTRERTATHVSPGRGRRKPYHMPSRRSSRHKHVHCSGTVRIMMCTVCVAQSASAVQGVYSVDENLHSEPAASRPQVAAPAPNPEAEIRDEHRLFATGLDQGRSEGWESSQTPGNGVSSESRAQSPPVKSGSEGRQEGTSFSRIRKRAYKRALNRASRGPTMYRGQQVTLHVNSSAVAHDFSFCIQKSMHLRRFSRRSLVKA